MHCTTVEGLIGIHIREGVAEHELGAVEDLLTKAYVQGLEMHDFLVKSRGLSSITPVAGRPGQIYYKFLGGVFLETYACVQ